MKLLCFFFVLSLSSSIYGQSYDESLLLKKWFYCQSDSATAPGHAKIMYFSTDENPCKPDEDSFYWEFKEQNKYVWSDIIPTEDSSIRAGVIAVPNEKWKLVGETLFLRELAFVIDVLDEKHLLIHLVED